LQFEAHLPAKKFRKYVSTGRNRSKDVDLPEKSGEVVHTEMLP
jgi:hypothetical protein